MRTTVSTGGSVAIFTGVFGLGNAILTVILTKSGNAVRWGSIFFICISVELLLIIVFE